MLLAALGNGDGMMVLAKLELGLEAGDVRGLEAGDVRGLGAGDVPGPAKASTHCTLQHHGLLADE